jgi:hypothetical protein
VKVIYQQAITDKIVNIKQNADMNRRKIEKILLTDAEWLQLRDENYFLAGLQLCRTVTFLGIPLELEK